jgi:excisionase family DNA binding protein
MDETTMDDSQDSTTQTPWRTVEQVAREEAQCGPKLIYREIQAGRLRAARIGGRREYRIHRDWVTEWLTRSAEPIEVRR